MLPYESPLIVLAQNRSKNRPTSKLIHGPLPWAIRSVTAMTVWMTLSLGGRRRPRSRNPAGAAHERWWGARRRDAASPTYDGRARVWTRARPSSWGDQLIGESVTMLFPSTR
jgi:hypothetical protein